MEKEKRLEDTTKVSKKYLDANIRLPVLSRVKKRLKQLHDLTKAKHVKIPIGNTHVFETTAPKMFVAKIEPVVRGNTGTITYQVYKMRNNPKTGELEKEPIITKREINGQMIEVDAHYIIEKIVVERFEYLKPMTTEEMKYDG